MANNSMGPMLAMDPQSLASLKTQANLHPNQSVKAVSQQFEGFLLNFLMKSMRDTVPKNDLTSSMASETYTSMLDQQYAQQLSQGKGIGIGTMLAKQLDKKSQGVAAPKAPSQSSHAPKASPTQKVTKPGAPEEFKAKMVDFASSASAATGVPTNFLLAQAGLESGWGKHQPKLSSGELSFNLFGIKAGPNWKGPTVDATTTEMMGGVPTKVVQSFKVYSSYEEAFKDYAATLTNHSRYSQALTADSASGFAQALQKAGYATDPLYASKLKSVIQRLETAVG